MEIIDSVNPNVIIIKNFLDNNQVEEVLSLLRNYSEDDWYLESIEKRKFGGLEGRLLEADINLWDGMTISLTKKEDIKKNFPDLPYDLLVEKENEVKKIVKRKFKDPLVLQMSSLHRWRPGREQMPHIDYYDSSEEHDFEMLERYHLPKHQLEEFEKSFNNKHYSALVYFNTDYVGGELYMPQWDWEIKPEPGMLIAFKGDENHLHGVKMVEEGIRYTWAMFWTKLDWAINNKNKRTS